MANVFIKYSDQIAFKKIVKFLRLKIKIKTMTMKKATYEQKMRKYKNQRINNILNGQWPLFVLMMKLANETITVLS